jgi:hypothetical protein
VPLHERIVPMIHELEDGRRARTPANLEELCGLNARAYPAETPS